MRCLITDEVKGNGQQNSFTIVAVSLHLSNIDFLLLVRRMQSGKSRQSLDIVARLLRVKSEDDGYTIVN